jgi:hypothetical protein
MFAPQSIINGCTLEAIKESYRRRSSLPWAVSEMSYSLFLGRQDLHEYAHVYRSAAQPNRGWEVRDGQGKQFAAAIA